MLCDSSRRHQVARAAQVGAGAGAGVAAMAEAPGQDSAQGAAAALQGTREAGRSYSTSIYGHSQRPAST